MIPFDFAYCRPDTLREAVDAFAAFEKEGRSPLYYAGGSEILSMARAGDIRPGAVIDIKRIAELNTLKHSGGFLSVGAAITLRAIKDSKLFPLLGTAGGRIADHTNQCRITLGGNLCGTILYRETSLALLLSEAQIVFFGPGGERREAFSRAFDGRVRRASDELVVRADIPGEALDLPYAHVKKTANEKIDYPLVTVAAVRHRGKYRAAFSGVCPFPFRSPAMEEALNDRSGSPEERVDSAARLLPAPPADDDQGSGEYRVFVLKNTLLGVLEEFEHGAD